MTAIAMGFEHVIVGTDFSRSQLSVLRRCLNLELAKGAALTLVHVGPEEDSASAGRAREIAAHLLELAVARLRRRLADQERRDVTVEGLLVGGRPEEKIVEIARRARADLVVIGGHARRRLRNVVIGTLPNRLLARCTMPVLVVRGQGNSVYRSIIAAVDVTSGAREVITRAIAAAPKGARVAAVHAAEIPFEDMLRRSIDARELGRLRREQMVRAREKMNELLGDDRGGLVAREVVAYGDPRDVLVTEIERRYADLVVVARERRSRVAHAFVSRVVDHLVRFARCDVLVVHTPPGA
jgi:nucleotide-binding universal stress UspA family protein